MSTSGSVGEGWPSWDELVKDHLISTGSVSGIAVLTKTGTCVYSYGILATHSDQNWSQFSSLFAETHDKSVAPKLSLVLESEVPFIVFQKTLCSMYATSSHNRYNMAVCSFPLGVLVCVGEPPTPMSKTVSAVENFCSVLRR